MHTRETRSGALRAGPPAGADGDAAVIPIPKQVGPCRFGRLGSWITVLCPQEFDTLMLSAGGFRDSMDANLWLLRQSRIGPVLRALRRSGARPIPPSQQVGVDLDR